MVHYLSQFAEDAQALRQMRGAVKAISEQLIVAGRAAGEWIAEAMARFEQAVFNVRTLAQALAEGAKQFEAASWAQVQASTIGRMAHLAYVTGLQLRPQAFMGFVRFYPDLLDATTNVTRDFYGCLIQFCTDNGVLDVEGLQRVLEMFRDPALNLKATFCLTRVPGRANTWISPSGPIFGSDPGGYGSRILHVLHHSVDDQGVG